MSHRQREPWNPWPTFSPFGSAATGLRVKAAAEAEMVPTASLRCQVLGWTRSADGIVAPMKLVATPLHES